METFLYGLAYLSSLSKEDLSTIDIKFLSSKLNFLYGDKKEYLNYYIDIHSSKGMFPSIQALCNKFGFDVASDFDVAMYSSKSFYDSFLSDIAEEELLFYQNLLTTETDLTEKQKLIKKINDLLFAGGEATSTTIDSSTIDIIDYSTKIIEEGINYPVKEWQDRLPKARGSVVSAIASPGGFKTTTALNLVYHNSVIGNLNSLYFYLEDTIERYMINLFSLWTYFNGERIKHNDLKSGLDANDKDSIERVRKLQEQFHNEMKGKVYFQGMQGLNADPVVFGRQISHIVKKYNIDLIVVDYVQRLKIFNPTRMGVVDYLNLMVGQLSNIAIGQGYDNKPCFLFMLSQISKDKTERAFKTNGRMQITDASEVSEVEKVSNAMLSLFATDDMKNAGQISYQILKNRDEYTNSNPEVTFVEPAYAFMGDVSELEGVYSQDTLSSVFSDSDW